jgi:hypothetical protein
MVDGVSGLLRLDNNIRIRCQLSIRLSRCDATCSVEISGLAQTLILR